MNPADYPPPPICHVLDAVIDVIYWPVAILVVLALVWVISAITLRGAVPGKNEI